MDAPAPDPKGVGLFHLAFDVPSKRAFAQAYAKLSRDGVETAPVDHRIGWGLYFNDPDGNGLEIYCDTRKERDGEPCGAGRTARTRMRRSWLRCATDVTMRSRHTFAASLRSPAFLRGGAFRSWPAALPCRHGPSHRSLPRPS